MERRKFLLERQSQLKEIFNEKEKATIEKKQKLASCKKWNLPINLVGLFGGILVISQIFITLPLWICIPNVIALCINLGIAITKDKIEENLRHDLTNLNLETINVVNELNNVIVELEQSDEYFNIKENVNLKEDCQSNEIEQEEMIENDLKL